MAAAIPILGAATTLAPFIGSLAASRLTDAGKERRAMLREAVERRKTGDYGMSAAEKRQMKQDLVGLPGPADMTGNVGGATGPLSGALAKKLQEKWRGHQEALAKAGGTVAEISQADAVRQANADKEMIAKRALEQQKLGAELASAGVEAAIGLKDDIENERETGASKAAKDIVTAAGGSAAAKAAAEGAR